MSRPTQSVPSVGNLCKISIHTVYSKETVFVEESLGDFLGDDYKLEDLEQYSFRWIHIPMNNMEWAEVRTSQIVQAK
jgi:hypothetical protein